MGSSPVVPPPPPGSVRVNQGPPAPPAGSVRVQAPAGPAPFSRPEDVPPVATTMGFLANIPASGGKLVMDLGSAIVNPKQTFEGIKTLLSDPSKMKDFIVERYGGLENAMWTLYNDPVGFAGDLSALTGFAGLGLRGGAAVARQAPRAAGLAEKATQAGQALESVSRAVDPITVAATGVGQVLKPVGALSTAAIGAGVGTGRKVVRIALHENTKPFRDALRGRIQSIDIIKDARDAIASVRRRRGLEYRQALAKLDTGLQIDLNPIRQELDDLLGEFRVKRGVDAKGNPILDFHSSAVGKSAHKDIAELVDVVDNWDDASVLGVDALKRRVGDVFGETKQSRAFAAQLGHKVRQSLEPVPFYTEMTRKYAIATEAINMINKELSLGGQYGTVIRKLANALNQNNDFRQLVVDALDAKAGSHLGQEIAGAALSTADPRGIMRPLAGGHLVYSLGKGEVGALRGLLLASPRAVGEALTAISALNRGFATVGRTLPSVPGAVVYRPFMVAPEAAQENE